MQPDTTYFDRVSRSPINTSISKHLYSFPKSARFSPSRESPCLRSYYDRPNTRTHRATSFGYGDKISLANKEPVPPPNAYDRPSTFRASRTYTFAHAPKRGVADWNLPLFAPGPGKYQMSPQAATLTSTFRAQPSFSLRQKYDDPLQRHQNPLGPGQYSVAPSLNQTGQYFDGRFRSSGCAKIDRSPRFQQEIAVVPGPGKYADNDGLNRSGVYFNSKMQSARVMGFDGTARPPINEKREAPGPGAYYIFSQFGSRQR